MDSGPTDNVHPTATKRNGQSVLQLSVLQGTTRGASFRCPGVSKPRSQAYFDRHLRHFFPLRLPGR
jgi:hypothetical protein